MGLFEYPGATLYQ